MTWEKVTKRTFGAAMPAVWYSVPAVSFRKTGISFNSLFCDTFGIRPETHVNLLIDAKGRRIGFQRAMRPEEIDAGFKVQLRGKGKRSTAGICCSRVFKVFPELIDTVLQAKMTASDSVIEVQIPEKVGD